MSKKRAYRITPARVKALQVKVLKWYQANGRHDLPWRKTRDPYYIIVSEVMLQQTQVVRVIPKYLAFITVYPNWQSLARAGNSRLLRLWSGLGYNRRALNLKRLAQRIVKEHQGRFPKDVSVLEQLPGIGPYTARAVLAFAYNSDVAAVDTNIRRILIHELKLPYDSSAKELQEVAEQVLPKGRSRIWHSALMDYGSAVATAKETGVRSLGKQEKFIGSNRWYRGQLLKLLLSEKKLTSAQAAKLLGISQKQIMPIVTQLVREGLIQKKNTILYIDNTN